ncbi:MAG: sulfotransferase family protein [Pseudomonadota bacterium]|nr:sulfotransferase family protein [Pseudomonadota bacterium]
MIRPGRYLYGYVPEPIRRNVVVWRCSLHWWRAGAVFIHVPKTAGTSFNQALYGRFIGQHLRAVDVARWAPPVVRALPSFAVVRNPWDRLVSAYRFARRGHGAGDGPRAYIRRPDLYRAPEFSSFERFVKEWLVEREVTAIEDVFRPQSFFLCDGRGNVLVDHVGRLEQLAPTCDFVARHTGRRLDLPRLNASGETVDYRRFYTPELARIVADIYRDDVALFGYGFDDGPVPRPAGS